VVRRSWAMRNEQEERALLVADRKENDDFDFEGPRRR